MSSRPLPTLGTPQQRAYVRVNAARLPARLWLCQPRVASLLDCVVLNLSGDGAYVEVDTRGMAPGAEVHMDFELPKIRRVSLSGRIVRIEPGSGARLLSSSPPPRCALRFVFAREAERDRLVAWVFAALAQNRRRSLQEGAMELAPDEANLGGVPPVLKT